MPSYDDLRILAAVVEARGFRPAGQRLGMSASTISDVVRRIEDEVALRLVERNTRSVNPTDAGRALLRGVLPGFAMVDRALETLHDGAGGPIGRLRLTVPEIVARYVLPPIVGRFLARFPGIGLDVSSDTAVLDIVDGGFDAAIRYEEHAARNMVTVPIGPRTQRYVAAATPAYLAARGVPTDPDQLAGHWLIAHRLASGAIRPWEFVRGRARRRITPSPRVVSPSVDIRLAAAIAGQGILYTFDEVVRPAIEEGTLTVVLDRWSASFPGSMLCYHGDRHVPGPLRAFVDFVAERSPD